MIIDKFVAVEMTVEQIVALRAILKLEHIRTMGAVTATDPDIDDFKRLESTVAFVDRWASLDRPLGIALFNLIAGDKPVTLTTKVPVLMTKADKVQIAEVLFRGHYLEILKNAKSVNHVVVSGFVTVVLIDRNYKTLRDIILPAPMEAEPFTFEQTPPPKGVLN